MEIELNEENFDKEIKTDKPFLIDFGASWCPPCQMMSPIVSELAQEFEETYKIGKVDTDENSGLATKFGITNLPTFLLFKNGEVVAKSIGAMPKGKLIDFMKNN